MESANKMLSSEEEPKKSGCSIDELESLLTAIEDGTGEVKLDCLSPALGRDLLYSVGISRPGLMNRLRRIYEGNQQLKLDEIPKGLFDEANAILSSNAIERGTEAEIAIYRRDLSALANALTDINWKLDPGWFGSRFLANHPTLVQFAALIGASDCCDFLIGRGADLELLDGKKRHLSQFLVAGGIALSNPSLLRPGDEKVLWRSRIRFHRNALLTPEDLARDGAIHEAAISGNLGVLRKLVSKVDARDSAGSTPLHLAVSNRRLASVLVLLSLGADPNLTDGARATPLHLACESGSLDFVDVLLNCDRTRLDIPDARGRCAVHVAAAAGHVEVFCRIIGVTPPPVSPLKKKRPPVPEDDCPTEEEEEEDERPFLMPSGTPNQEAHRLTEYGEAPIHVAVASGQLQISEVLMQQIGVDLGRLTIAGENVAHIAARQKCLGKFELLVLRVFSESLSSPGVVSAPAGPLNHRDVTGFAPIHYAVAAGDVRGTRILLVAHTDARVRPLWKLRPDREFWKVMVSQKTGAGQTALHLAVKRGLTRLVEGLIEAGADVNASDLAGWCPMHCAGKTGAEEILRSLINAGADVNCQDGGGWTPLHNTVNYRQVMAAEALLSRPDINVNLADSSGWTALHVAALNHDRGMSQRLASAPGMDASIRDNAGRTAEELAEIAIFRPGCEACPSDQERRCYFELGPDEFAMPIAEQS